MKYLLLIYMDENAMSDTEREHCYVESAQVAQDLYTKGQFVASAPLHPVATATRVQVCDNSRLLQSRRQKRNPPGQSPFVLTPAARTLLSTVAGDRVPVAIGFSLINGRDLK